MLMIFHLYFGLGCRNVTKIYVPEDYDFIPLLNALKKYRLLLLITTNTETITITSWLLLIMNNKYYMTNGSIILTENKSFFSPISILNFEYYKNIRMLKPK